MRRAGQAAADHPHDLPQLVHQPFLRVQAARGIHDDGVQSAGDRRVDGVERDRRRIAAGRAGDAGDVEPCAPRPGAG